MSYCKLKCNKTNHTLNLIPFNFICVQMKFKTASISTVYNSILWLICIIYHTVFAVCHIRMYIHIEVFRVPFSQVLLRHGAATLRFGGEFVLFSKAVWKTADINATSFSKLMHCHLNFFVTLNQNLCIFACKHALLAFTEIHIFCAVL